MQGLGDHGRVGVALAAVGGTLVLWALAWPVPTEVEGQGVLLPAEAAGIVDARAGGQVEQVLIKVGDRVRRGQVLLTLRLPVLRRQLEQQSGNLAQLERQDRELNERDRLRLASERTRVDTALAKIKADRRHLSALRQTFSRKLTRLRWLSAREVVAPLAAELVRVEQGLTEADVALDGLTIRQKEILTELDQVRLAIETEALQRRYGIEDLRRQREVTRAQLRFDGRLLAQGDGTVLDLQVIPGQTVREGQRLGTIGPPLTETAGRGGAGRSLPLRAVAYFRPGDARRLPGGLPVEVVPAWHQRGRFGGMVGRVRGVAPLPATEADIATTTGNPQLARDLVKDGPVLRSDIDLEQDPRSDDGYRWTLSQGSEIFPIREGLTIQAHAYVEWRPPISYLIPGWRSLTGGYRRFGRRL